MQNSPHRHPAMRAKLLIQLDQALWGDNFLNNRLVLPFWMLG